MGWYSMLKEYPEPKLSNTVIVDGSFWVLGRKYHVSGGNPTVCVRYMGTMHYLSKEECQKVFTKPEWIE